MSPFQPTLWAMNTLSQFAARWVELSLPSGIDRPLFTTRKVLLGPSFWMLKYNFHMWSDWCQAIKDCHVAKSQEKFIIEAEAGSTLQYQRCIWIVWFHLNWIPGTIWPGYAPIQHLHSPMAAPPEHILGVWWLVIQRQSVQWVGKSFLGGSNPPCSRYSIKISDQIW